MANPQCDLPRRCLLLYYLSAERQIHRLRWVYPDHGTLNVLYACLATISYENESSAIGCSQVVRCLGVQRAPFLLFYTRGLFGFLGMNMPLYYVTKYAISYGMSSTLASYLLPVLNAASVAGCIISNVCKDTPFLHPCHKVLSLCLSNSMEQIRQAQ